VRDPDKKALVKELRELVRLAIKILKKYAAEFTNLTTIEGDLMSDYPLTVLDSVVVTLAYTDDVSGDAVTPDAGSVAVALSNAPADSVVLDESQTFCTLTAGPSPVAGNTITVTGTVGGIASTPWVGVYDVVAAAPPDATTITGTFGSETVPSFVDAAAAEAPAFTPGGAGDPEFRLNEATGTYDHV
jgi:hypothetical protein